MRACTCVWCVCMCMCMVYMHVHVYGVYACVCTHARIHVDRCMYTKLHACMHTSIDMCVCVCVCVCVCDRPLPGRQAESGVYV